MSEGYSGVWVVAEQYNGHLTETTIELLGKANELAKQLDVQSAAVLIGYEVRPLADELFAYGADKVFIVDEPVLRLYQSEHYPKILTALVLEHRPEIVLLTASTIGQELAARTAAKLKTGLTAHCVGLELDENRNLVMIVPGFGGNLMVRNICPQTRPQMATVRGGVFKKLSRSERTGEIVNVSYVPEKESRARTIEITEPSGNGKNIEQAEIIIAGGWGLKTKENFELLNQLAELLGGMVGGTRPAVDEGWIPESQMIGQSGKIVRPLLYIGIGISGAMHHLVGIRDSKLIVAVNNDPKAPIFEFADIGLIGDSHEILRYLLAKLKRKKLK